MHNLVVILGPTASGKSALGVALAKKYHGIVISADSRQVYRGMDVGTGKITKKEMRGVPHFLLSVASPRSQYSVARYVRDAVRVIKKIPKSTPIFLVGGSPFYIDALTKPNSFSPIPPNPTLRRRLAKQKTAQLITQLQRLNPGRLQNIDTANRRRLIRAIEIASYKPARPPLFVGTNPPLLPSGGATSGASGVAQPLRILKIGISTPKSKLHRLIDRRVEARMKLGMLAEVATVHRQGLSWKKLDAFGLEYRFLSRYLQKKLTKVEAVSQLKSATHNFAKRQMTWWKRDREIHWVTKPTEAAKMIKDFLSSSSRS